MPPSSGLSNSGGELTALCRTNPRFPLHLLGGVSPVSVRSRLRQERGRWSAPAAPIFCGTSLADPEILCSVVQGLAGPTQHFIDLRLGNDERRAHDQRITHGAHDTAALSTNVDIFATLADLFGIEVHGRARVRRFRQDWQSAPAWPCP